MSPFSFCFAAREKSVQWKLGADGDIWVWVMGEHTLDKPYDLLCGEILAERMRQLSLQEAEVARLVWLSKHSTARMKKSGSSGLVGCFGWLFFFF